MIAVGAAGLIAPAAFAHRSQSVLSSLTWNAAASRLEVVHRFHTDDAEIGLARHAGMGDFLDLGLVRNQARLLVYLESHFAVDSPEGRIVLDPVGVDPRGMEIHAYQEAVLSAAPDVLTIENDILRDVFTSQTNLVNVRIAERTRTLIFSGRDRAKRVDNLG